MPEKPLVECAPRWIGAHGHPELGNIGVAFDCPICAPEKDHMIFVPFMKMPNDKPRDLWEQSGDTFETLTLNPSIKITPNEWFPCGFHGWVIQGKVTW